MVALAALGFLVYQTPKDSFGDVFRQISWPWIASAVFFQIGAHTLSAFRWNLLLRANEIHIAKMYTIRLTFLGLFYNNVMPGGIGGDLLKGWYVTRHSPETKRVEAAITVCVDRVIGLLGIILIGSIASIFVESHISYQGFQLRWLPLILLSLVSTLTFLFFCNKLHKTRSIRQLLLKLPFAKVLSQIDQAVRFYKHHTTTVLQSLFLTLILQLTGLLAFWCLTQSLHFTSIRFVHCLVIMPFTSIVSAAIPVPGGMGVVEGCIMYLFCVVINPDNPVTAMGQAAALALINRIVILYVCSLPGLLVPLLGGHLPKGKDLVEAVTKNAIAANLS